MQECQQLKQPGSWSTYCLHIQVIELQWCSIRWPWPSIIRISSKWTQIFSCCELNPKMYTIASSNPPMAAVVRVRVRVFLRHKALEFKSSIIAIVTISLYENHNYNSEPFDKDSFSFSCVKIIKELLREYETGGIYGVPVLLWVVVHFRRLLRCSANPVLLWVVCDYSSRQGTFIVPNDVKKFELLSIIKVKSKRWKP